SIRKKETFCPKFLGLPDMSISIFKELGSKMISPEIREKNERISGWKNYRIIGEMFSIPDKEIKAAIKKAGRVWDDFRAKSLRGFAINDILQKKAGSGADAGTDSGGRPEERRNGTAPAQSSLKLHSNVINIGLMGYVYNICDNYISMDIIGKLKEKGINVITFEMLGPEIPYSNLKHLRKPLFWTFSNYLLGAGHYFLDQENIDGIIHVTAFGCGPDSYIGKMMELLSEEKKKPFLTIRVDEHSGESHLITRVEAFTDMIERKKALDEGRISLS
ncbi:MAG: acyl-CoA dehydratase activase-related protein, partial [Eubacteriales bacterium]|nr:acyl-CoA dehydratase activase-related protein [Eubacteriales bacterium]